MPFWSFDAAQKKSGGQIIVDRSAMYDGIKRGTYWIRAGAFTSNGPFSGVLKVSSKDPCHIVGMFKGDLNVLEGATVYVHGMFKGDVSVAKVGTLVLMHGAMFKGHIVSQGTVMNEGALVSGK